MDEYITFRELAQLLAIFWLPCFALGALAQRWALARAHAPRRRVVSVLLIALGAEILLSFVAWVSPVSQLAIPLNVLGSLSIGEIPLECAAAATVVVTGATFAWAHRQRPRAT